MAEFSFKQFHNTLIFQCVDILKENMLMVATTTPEPAGSHFLQNNMLKGLTLNKFLTLTFLPVRRFMNRDNAAGGSKKNNRPDEPPKSRIDAPDLSDKKTTILLPGNALYVGQRKNRKIHGKGILSFSNGITYEGQFRKGKGTGQGTLIFSDGKKYVGGFKNGKGHGPGTLLFPDGKKYEGEFKKGRFHRHGLFTSPSGYQYRGSRKNGQYHGYGSMTFMEGFRYSGQWKNGKFHGQGILTYPDGHEYIGTWKKGKFQKKRSSLLIGPPFTGHSPQKTSPDPKISKNADLNTVPAS